MAKGQQTELSKINSAKKRLDKIMEELNAMPGVKASCRVIVELDFGSGSAKITEITDLIKD